jgi:nickel transport protein
MDLCTSCFLRVVAPCVFLAGILPAVARAHELDASVTLVAPAVVIRAAYGGSDPVPFAKVQVFAPSPSKEQFQTGVTDRRGYFSFVPEGPGSWRVVIDDEEGHRREIQVTIPQTFASTSLSPLPTSSRLERALLGISLIFGATGFLYGFKARRISNRSASREADSK